MKDERKCKARRRDGKPCSRWAISGSTVCASHGGRAPQVKAAAHRRIVEADALATLAYQGIKPIGDPIEELGKLASETSAMKDALAARVNALDSPTYDFMGQSKIRAEVELYNSALDRCIRVLDLLGKHDLNDRLVKVEEQTGQLFQYVITGVLNDIGLTPEQSAKTQKLIVKWLNAAHEGVKARELPDI